jgi:hypothetical protein
MVLDATLQTVVSEGLLLLRRIEAQKFRQLLVRDDLPLIDLILKIVLLDVLAKKLGDIYSASLFSLGPSCKCSHVIRDLDRLQETRVVVILAVGPLLLLHDTNRLISDRLHSLVDRPEEFHTLSLILAFSETINFSVDETDQDIERLNHRFFCRRNSYLGVLFSISFLDLLLHFLDLFDLLLDCFLPWRLHLLRFSCCSWSLFSLNILGLLDLGCFLWWHVDYFYNKTLVFKPTFLKKKFRLTEILLYYQKKIMREMYFDDRKNKSHYNKD